MAVARDREGRIRANVRCNGKVGSRGRPHAIDTNRDSLAHHRHRVPIVLSLMLVAAIVLVRSLVNFLDDWNEFRNPVVSAIDGILVVIILLDIAHTVFGHLRASVFPVRPSSSLEFWPVFETFLSSSAHLALSGTLSSVDFRDTMISLASGSGSW